MVRYHNKAAPISPSVPHREFPLAASVELNRFLADVERRAYRMAFLATGNQDDALDIVQDAMLDFVRRYTTKSENEWPPLFHRVLQSRITDWHRRSLVRNRLRIWFGFGSKDGEEEECPLEKVADPIGTTPASLLLNRELGAKLDKAIRALPLRQQQAFLLRAWEGLDVAETAAAMGCSGGSVKTHYFRAITALRNVLEEYQ